MREKAKKKKATHIILIVTIVSLLLVIQVIKAVSVEPYPKKVFVKKVIDGDTFKDASGKKYRLLGVDTPEYGRDGKPDEPFAQEATNFTKKHIENKYVVLEYADEKFDKYNRLLVLVYTPEGEMLERLLLQEGLADVFRKAKHKYKKEFYDIENKAKKQQKGKWKK